jgi:peptide/nickel transport system substrate-binding protein
MHSSVAPRFTRRQWLGMTGAMTAGFVLTAAGCSRPAPTRAQTKELIFGQIAEPTNLDVIARAGDVASTELLQQIYSELVHYDYGTGKISPELAESWQAAGPLQWDLKLREGVQFHKDYGEFTADDVEFNVNYTIQNKAPRVNRFSFVKGATATGKYTVRFELEKPFAPFFLSTLRGIAGQMVSKKAYSEMGAQAFSRNPIGTGPWQLDSWKPGQLILSRHPKYFKSGLPYLDKITAIPVPDALVRRQKIEAGEIDFTGQADYKDVAELQNSQNVSVIKTPGQNWDYIAFNLKDESLPFQHKEVRQAISFALNRQAIVDSIYLGQAIPTDSPLPPGFLGNTKGPIMYPFDGDVARAKALMQQAGMANGFTVTCITSDRPDLTRGIQVVADQLRQINVNLNIQGMDRASYVQLRDKNNFQMLFESINLVSPDSDDALVNFQYSKGNNNAGWVSPEVDSLIDEARSTVGDDGRRAADYQRIVQLTVEGAGYVYIVHYNVARLLRKGLSGFAIEPYDQEIFLEPMRWA